MSIFQNKAILILPSLHRLSTLLPAKPENAMIYSAVNGKKEKKNPKKQTKIKTVHVLNCRCIKASRVYNFICLG